MSNYSIFCTHLRSLILAAVVALLYVSMSGMASKNLFEGNLYVYKVIDGDSLYIEMVSPDPTLAVTRDISIIFFFGGGWNGGDRSHFSHHADHFASKGYTCFLADYRTAGSHGTTPFDAVEDAKSAMRYLKSHASDFSIHPDKIIASGGSAGGHLAAACAFITDYNYEKDDVSIDAIPYALVLYNPVINNGPEGYGYERIGNEYVRFSPLHNIRDKAPPTIFFLGDEDNLILTSTAEKYKAKYDAIGARCELKIYPGGKHGFFNYRNEEYYRETIKETEQFLISLHK